MATVRQTGGDYSSLNAALAAAESTITIDQAWTARDDTAATVTADCTITVSGGALHSGYFLESDDHYRLSVTAAHCLTINGAYTVTITGMAIHNRGVGSSEECIRCVPGTSDTVTLNQCILVCDGIIEQQDCIYAGFNTSIGTITLNNCTLQGAARFGIHSQNNYSTSSQSGTINVNHCTIMDNGRDTGPISVFEVGGGIGFTKNTSGAATSFAINVFGCVVVENDAGSPYSSAAPQDFYDNNQSGNASFTAWNVSYSIDSDGSISTDTDGGTGNGASYTATESTTPGAGNWVIIEDLTSSIWDCRLVDDTDNDAQGFHSTSSAHGLSVPSTDIVGTTRSSPYDAGSFRASPAGGAAVDLLTRRRRIHQRNLST
jgi:hypothetical protein